MKRLLRSAVIALIVSLGPTAAVAQDDPPPSPDAYRAIELTNLERAKAGLAPLKAHDALMTAAARHSRDMAENRYFSHTSRDGRAPWDRAQAAGYAACRAENIYMGSGVQRPEAAVAGWMRSPGHRAAIMNPAHVEIGVGVAQRQSAPKDTYWTQTLGASDDSRPVIINNEAWATSSGTVELYIHGDGKATQMCLSNDGKQYGRWEPFISRRTWTLEPGLGLRTVYVVTRDAQGRVCFANDSILVEPGRAAASPTPAAHPGPAEASAPQTAPQAPAAAGGGLLPPVGDLGIGGSRPRSPVGPALAGPVYWNSRGLPVVPMVFPVANRRSMETWSDTWGAPRAGGRRRHRGQDLFAEKRTLLVACFDATVYFHRTSRANAHNTLYLQGDSGWSAAYMHINNDNPGTDDGMGSERWAFAPGLSSGDRVKAGQFIAYLGDSGNAEDTPPHLHFELHSSHGAVNAAATLRAAREGHQSVALMLARAHRSTQPAEYALVDRKPAGKPLPPSVQVARVPPVAPNYSYVADAVKTPEPVAARLAQAERAQRLSARQALAEEQREAEYLELIDSPDMVVAAQVQDLVNEHRARYNRPALTLDPRLARTAAAYGVELAECEASGASRRRYPEVEKHAAEAGYPTARIVVIAARNGEDAQDVVDAWIERNVNASANLLSKDHVQIGAARVPVRGGRVAAAARYHWVVVLALPQDNG